MDADIRAAMFDADFDNGELWDDFVQRASAAPEGGVEAEAFDYDAHIARLVASSEKALKLGHAESDGESDDGSEYSDGIDGSSAAAVHAHEDRDFEKALLEYDSDECGPLDDPEDDPRLQVYPPNRLAGAQISGQEDPSFNSNVLRHQACARCLQVLWPYRADSGLLARVGARARAVVLFAVTRFAGPSGGGQRRRERHHGRLP